MKVYERNEKNNYRYPEDMAKILSYLNGYGKILVKDSTIEDLYYEFSYKEYSASWIDVSIRTLREFEEWLCDYEL